MYNLMSLNILIRGREKYTYLATLLFQHGVEGKESKRREITIAYPSPWTRAKECKGSGIKGSRGVHAKFYFLNIYFDIYSDLDLLICVDSFDRTIVHNCISCIVLPKSCFVF